MGADQQSLPTVRKCHQHNGCKGAVLEIETALYSVTSRRHQTLVWQHHDTEKPVHGLCSPVVSIPDIPFTVEAQAEDIVVFDQRRNRSPQQFLVKRVNDLKQYRLVPMGIIRQRLLEKMGLNRCQWHKAFGPCSFGG